MEIVNLRLAAEKSGQKRKNKAISIQKCSNDKLIAVMTGHDQRFGSYKVNRLHILKHGEDSWQYFKIINLDEELFDNVCLTFHFMSFGRQSIIFANNRQIFEMNYQKDSLNVLADFKTPLNFQPDYFVMSDDEQFVLVATPDDAIYFNRLTQTEVDLDELH